MAAPPLAPSPNVIELTLAADALPRLRRHPLLAALTQGRPRRIRERAIYFDTPDLALARADLALSVRRVGRVAVQTVSRLADARAERARAGRHGARERRARTSRAFPIRSCARASRRASRAGRSRRLRGRARARDAPAARGRQRDRLRARSGRAAHRARSRAGLHARADGARRRSRLSRAARARAARQAAAALRRRASGRARARPAARRRRAPAQGRGRRGRARRDARSAARRGGLGMPAPDRRERGGRGARRRSRGRAPAARRRAATALGARVLRTGAARATANWRCANRSSGSAARSVPRATSTSSPREWLAPALSARPDDAALARFDDEVRTQRAANSEQVREALRSDRFPRLVLEIRRWLARCAWRDQPLSAASASLFLPARDFAALRLERRHRKARKRARELAGRRRPRRATSSASS